MRARSSTVRLAAFLWFSACGRSGLPELVGSTGAAGSLTAGGSSGSTGSPSSGGTTTGGNSLQGPWAFEPNSTLAYLEGSGCPEVQQAGLFFTLSTPPVEACVFKDGSSMVTYQRSVAIQFEKPADAELNGTYEVTGDFVRLYTPDAGRLAGLIVSGQTASYPYFVLSPVAVGVSGTVTITASCTGHFSGNFDAVLSAEDGGESQLTGTFDTQLICGPF